MKSGQPNKSQSYSPDNRMNSLCTLMFCWFGCLAGSTTLGDTSWARLYRHLTDTFKTHSPDNPQTKMLVCKNFCSKEILGPKDVGSKKFFIKQFGAKNVLSTFYTFDFFQPSSCILFLLCLFCIVHNSDCLIHKPELIFLWIEHKT